MNPATQHQLFLRALDLLGGSRSAARAIGVSERTIDRLKSGTSALHAGLLRDISAALTAHAAACRQLERDLSPAFAANLTPAQLDVPLKVQRGGKSVAFWRQVSAQLKDASTNGLRPAYLRLNRAALRQIDNEIGLIADPASPTGYAGQTLFGHPWSLIDDHSDTPVAHVAYGDAVKV